MFVIFFLLFIYLFIYLLFIYFFFFAFFSKEFLFNEAYSAESIPSIKDDGAPGLNVGMDPSIHRSIEWIRALHNSSLWQA